MEYLSAIKARRSCYSLGNMSTLSKEGISHIISDCVLHAPSAFNCQSARVLVLFSNAHYKFWQIVMNTLRAKISESAFPATEYKIKGFSASKGTILFFNDDDITKDLQEKYPLYASNFSIWAEQANGMLQYMVWTALATENIGASLQHYNPIIDNQVKDVFNVPNTWRLIAQMPFGNIKNAPDKKDFLPLQNRIKIIEDFF